MRPIPVVSIALVLLGLAGVPAEASVLIRIDKSSQRMTVAVDGVPRWTWPVSTGRPGYDTPSGSFTAFRMEADHFSKEWDDAPMPHSIFFTPKGHAIHGYLDTRHIGSPASHGCVRLAPENAAKLYALVEEEGLPNTKVVLTGDVQLALGRRGLPRGSEVNAADEPSQGPTMRPYGYAPQYGYPPQYGYAPRYDYRQPQYGPYGGQPYAYPANPPSYYSYRGYR
jgi:L,D-transpeptidase catalytic domain